MVADVLTRRGGILGWIPVDRKLLAELAESASLRLPATTGGGSGPAP